VYPPGQYVSSCGAHEIRGAAATVTFRTERTRGGFWCVLAKKRPCRVVRLREASNSAGPVAVPRAFLARFKTGFSDLQASMSSAMSIEFRRMISERQIEFMGVVLGMPAPRALDAHPDDYRDPVHAGALYGSALASPAISAAITQKYVPPALTSFGPTGPDRKAQGVGANLGLRRGLTSKVLYNPGQGLFLAPRSFWLLNLRHRLVGRCLGAIFV